MKKGWIILLNGVSSSGKTTIAHALINQLDPFFHLSIDEYAYYIEKMENRDEKRMIPIPTEYLFHKTIKMFSDHNVDIVVDHILHDEYTKRNWFELLHNYPVLYVGIMCDMEDVEKRERDRGDRVMGQGRSQLEFTHLNMNYDIEINTSRNHPADCAGLIIEALEKKFMSEFENKIDTR